MNDTDASIGPWLRVSLLIVSLVLLSGATLFFLPQLMVPRWPWDLKPFNARFLGSVYTAELVAVLFTLVVGRWAPARLTIPQALIFTTLVTVASLIGYRHHFDPSRWITWAWFAVYIVPTLILNIYFWQNLGTPPADPRRPPGVWRTYLLIQGVILGLYGAGLFLSPMRFSAFWPWQLDPFHAQSYSALFLAGAAGSLILYQAAARIELATLGFSQAVFGLLAILGVVIVDAAVQRVDWSAVGTWVWMVGFGVLLLAGLGLAWSARAFPGEVVAAQ